MKKEIENMCNLGSALFQLGVQQGRQQVAQQGEKRFAKLISKLVTLGRIEDIEKACVDENYRQKLYSEMEVNNLEAN